MELLARLQAIAEWFGLDLQNLFGVVVPALWGVSRFMGTTVQSGTQGLKFSFGRAVAVLEPGFHPLLPGVQTVVAAPTRARTLDLPTQTVTAVDGLVYALDVNATFHLSNLRDALVEVRDLDRALLDRLAIAVFQVVSAEDRRSMTDLERFDRAAHERLAAAVAPWGVTIDRVSFTSVSPVGASLRVAQLRAWVGERLVALRALEAGGLSRQAGLSVLGTPTRYVPRTRRSRWAERNRRVMVRQRWEARKLPEAKAEANLPRFVVWGLVALLTIAVGLCAGPLIGMVTR